MKTKYDDIGINYTVNRCTDPRILEQIMFHLKGAERIINIGAGTGSYEPEHIDLVAVEPSTEMIAQRSKDAHPVVQASAEELPFESKSFSHGMTVLSMHHWEDQGQAFKEINRVVRDKFVAISWDPSAGPFWLTRDYFPEIHEKDRAMFPPKELLEEYFDEVEISPLMIPEDCEDGFMAAFWKRPKAYLQPSVRQCMSNLAKLESDSISLKRLKEDLENGNWEKRNHEILDKSSLDAGYIIISAKTRNN